MERLWEELAIDWPDWVEGVKMAIYLAMAIAVGAIPGLERESEGESAGFRTHILVSLGAALFVLAIRQYHGTSADISRVIQGIATGIGFVGGGTILKMKENQEVRGLTTAAGIWLTAGLGCAVGLGRIWLALGGAIAAWIVLRLLKVFAK